MAVRADPSMMTKAAKLPDGYVRCAGPGCMTHIWRPKTKRPLCDDCKKVEELTRAIQRNGAAGARRVLRGR